MLCARRYLWGLLLITKVTMKKGRPAGRPSTIVDRSLERELRSQLHQPGIGKTPNSSDTAEVSTVYVRVWSSEIGVIESVICLQPQLKVCSLCDLRILHDREVEIAETGTMEVAAWHVAQLPKRRVRHGSRIEPVVVLRAEYRRTRIEDSRRCYQIGTIWARVEGVDPTTRKRRNVRGLEEEREATLERVDT